MRVYLTIFALIFSSHSFAEEFFLGENLITPYKLDTGQYDVLKRTGRGLKSMMWRDKEKGMADAYVVSIYTTNAPLQLERENQDEPGRKSCASFESINLAPATNQNFDSMMWRTVCSDGKQIKSQILQLLIRGKDSLYHLQKIWRGEIDKAELDKWVNMFSEVYVCDTREKTLACPADFTKMGNL